MEEEYRRERRRAEHMARAAAWQLEKEEAEEAKVVPSTCSLQTTELKVIQQGKYFASVATLRMRSNVPEDRIASRRERRMHPLFAPVMFHLKVKTYFASGDNKP